MTDYRTAPRRTNDSPLARLRLERGITQSQLADMVGCHRKDISRWENGGRNPSGKSLIKLAQALNCPIDSLIQIEQPGD